MNKCQQCQNQIATVHVTEIHEADEPSGPVQTIQQQHLCDGCAQALNLPHVPVQSHPFQNIWKILQIDAQVRKRRGSRQCPKCKMTLEELRRGGKVGCPEDYQVFKDYLGELLERMHGATRHVGRLPGLGEQDLERRQQIGDLKRRLERAIRNEDYEDAAGLRDQLKTLEQEHST